MLYCERCREKNKWTRSAGYPYIGFKTGVVCEQCRKLTDCHDVPAIKLVSESEKTAEQKLLDKMMQDAYRERCEGFAVYYGSGKFWQSMTDEIRNTFAYRNGEVDWHDTYELRVALREQILNAERNRR